MKICKNCKYWDQNKVKTKRTPDLNEFGFCESNDVIRLLRADIWDFHGNFGCIFWEGKI